ncbi:MAG: LacI family transcriptional regulator [Acidimicrobiales bacterium]|nr:LacI family DNA-binding transcriptional regulator [Hyphomonadaceae bacterium]RZV42997.1 MAG: LacI family transcriptional regulator [Acidimicrobiales bacterium]
MAELARLADVDVSTVSRALNDSPLVKADTKAHVLKIAAETGYVVNASARNLRRQSAQAIGIVIPMAPGSGQTISDPFFLEMVGAVSHAASQKGYDLIVSVPQSETEIAERRLLLTGRADGLIVIGQAGRSERLNKLNTLKSNIVVWGGREGNPNYTLVGSDNKRGGRLASEHLLSLGRKRILFLGDIDLPEVALRYEGYKLAHEEAEVAFDDSLILRQNFGGETAFHALKDFLAAGHEFDAIFAASDVLAMAAIQAVQSASKRVPEDIAVVGYDNVGQASMSTPSLTTIDQHITQGGQMLVNLLLDKIDGKPVKSAFTKTELVVRRSSGA